jgi:hypothetical protein
MKDRPCPTSAELQDFADGVCDALSAAAADRHLLDCATCRDRVRTLRHVAKFATAWRDERASNADTALLIAKARAQVRDSLGARPAARATISAARMLRAAAFLAALVAAAFVAWKIGARSEPETPPPVRSANPDRSDVESPIVRAEEERSSRLVPAPPISPAPTFGEALADALSAPGRLDDVVRRVGRLLSAPGRTAEEIVAGSKALLETAGPRAEATLHRVFRASGLSFEAAEPLLAAMQGNDATRALVAGYSSREPTAAGLAALRARPGALDAARAAAVAAPRDGRVRAAALVAHLGGDDAVEVLSDGLRDPTTRDQALRALCASGSPASLTAVARLLPTAESFAPDLRDPETVAVEAAARRAPDVGPRAAAAAESAARASDRRRLLLLAALSGDVATLPAFERAAERVDDRSTVFVAIGVLGAPEGAAILSASLAKTADRGARRKATEALGSLSGPAATTALTQLLAAPADRRGAVAALSARPDATPALIAALAFPDAREAAFTALRSRTEGAGPKSPDPGAWARWWRKKTDRE